MGKHYASSVSSSVPATSNDTPCASYRIRMTSNAAQLTPNPAASPRVVRFSSRKKYMEATAPPPGRLLTLPLMCMRTIFSRLWDHPDRESQRCLIAFQVLICLQAAMF